MRQRAVLAAFVGTVGAVFGVAGVGHAYLRRWRRAALWFVGVLGVSVGLVFAFADPQTVTPETLPPTVVGPVVGLLLVSVLDAYIVARRGGRAQGQGAERGHDEQDGDTEPSCPSCGRSIDRSLDFCWYCSERLDAGSGPGHGTDADDATSR